MSVSDYSTTPGDNVQISGINLAEGCAPSGINDALRQMMADLATEKTSKDKSVSDLQALIDTINATIAQKSAFWVPSGGIIAWAGSASNIPTGWYLCNGQNGTPNLQDRFIVGAGSGYGVGAKGGNNGLTVSGSMSGNTSGTTLSTDQIANHNHFVGYEANLDWGHGAGGEISRVSGYTGGVYTGAVGSNGSHAHWWGGSFSTWIDNKPPYYALCFIMKG